MKKVLLLFSFLPLFSFAQEVVSDKNEVGLNLFSVTNFGMHKDMLDKRVYNGDMNAFSGIYYRRHFGKYALRASFDYTQKAQLSSSGSRFSPYYYNVSAITKNISMSLGYQHSFATKKFQPYFFTDLVFNYINFSGHSTSYGDFSWFENRPFS
ncbi:MAG: hypothetical protein M3R17_19535, partial [Bacteroidota bacterium]|nr:hypothetical protein [Bacteroidota bacterium]